MLGSLIPAAAGVALSPVPIIELIFVLFLNRRGPNSVAFVVSLIALTAAAVALGVAGQQATESSAGETSKGAAVGLLVLGLVLVAVGVKNWRNRADHSEPRVFAKIADMGPGAAAFLALGATFLNPKNVVLLIAAGQTIGASTSGSKLTIGAVFVLIATLPYTAAVGYALLAGEHARTRLDAARAWLISHNRAIMGVSAPCSARSSSAKPSPRSSQPTIRSRPSRDVIRRRPTRRTRHHAVTSPRHFKMDLCRRMS